jgi:hypothetical protein
MTLKINQINFLAPAHVYFEDDGLERLVYVDMINHRIYDQNQDDARWQRWELAQEEEFFNFLERSVRLPDDVYTINKEGAEELNRLKKETDIKKYMEP